MTLPGKQPSSALLSLVRVDQSSVVRHQVQSDTNMQYYQIPQIRASKPQEQAHTNRFTNHTNQPD